MLRRDRTLLIPQTFRCQMLLQCMTLPLRDARLEEDAASGASVLNQPQVNASVLPVICVEYDAQGEARLQQWGSRETNHHYVHAHCVNGGLGHDHELFPKQPTDQDAVDAVTRQRGHHHQNSSGYRSFYSLLPKTRTKPQQQLHLMMSETFLDEKRLSAGMRRLWTSSGSNMSHGTASKTCVAQRMFNLPRGSNLRCSKPNMPSFELSSTTTQPLLPQNQPGKRWCLAAGSSWDDRQSMPLRATVPTSWTLGWSFFWAEDWSALWGHGTF